MTAVNEDPEMAELSRQLAENLATTPAAVGADINRTSPQTDFHISMPSSTVLQLRKTGAQQHVQFVVALARLQDEQQILAREERAKVSTEQPTSEVGWANLNLLRWTDLEYICRADPAVLRWMRPEAMQRAEDRFKVMEFSEFRYLMHPYYKHYAVYPQYNENMTKRFSTDQDRRPIGVNLQFAALLMRLRADANSADVLTEEMRLVDHDADDSSMAAAAADALNGLASNWRLYYAVTDADHTTTASPDLEQQLKKTLEQQQQTQKKTTPRQQPYKPVAWRPTPVQLKVCPVSCHLSGSHVSLVRAEDRQRVLYWRLPQCRDEHTLRMPVGYGHNYDVLLHLIEPPHGVMFIRHSTTWPADSSEFMLHYFDLSSQPRHRFGVRLSSQPTCLWLCREQVDPALLRQDLLYWGAADCGTYWLRLPAPGENVTVEQLGLRAASLWATDEEEVTKGETDGYLYSTRAAEPPRNLFVAPYSRHACQTSASNLTFVVRRPMRERIPELNLAPTPKPTDDQRKQLQDAFTQTYITKAAPEHRLAPLPAHDDWPRHHDLIFQRDSLCVISSAIIGNMLVVHDATGNVVLSALMGGAPGKPLGLFHPTKAGLPVSGAYTGTYQSVAASIGRIVILQPNGVLVFLVPMSMDEVRAVLQAKEQLVVEEQFKQVVH